MGRKAKPIPAGVLEAAMAPKPRKPIAPIVNAVNLFESYKSDFTNEARLMAKAIEEGQTLYNEEAANLWITARAHISGMWHAFTRFNCAVPRDIEGEILEAQEQLADLMHRGRHSLA